ncbi:MAG TPA: hypothetical protein VGH74_22685 [Planctomycetaceae bacterium]|jgi:hypothetical protein
MAKKKDKPTNAKKKLAAIVAKMEKKKALIARQSKKLKALKDKAAKFIAKNPELKPPARESPKTAARRKKRVAT